MSAHAKQAASPQNIMNETRLLPVFDGELERNSPWRHRTRSFVSRFGESGLFLLAVVALSLTGVAVWALLKDAEKPPADNPFPGKNTGGGGGRALGSPALGTNLRRLMNHGVHPPHL